MFLVLLILFILYNAYFISAIVYKTTYLNTPLGKSSKVFLNLNYDALLQIKQGQ